MVLHPHNWRHLAAWAFKAVSGSFANVFAPAREKLGSSAGRLKVQKNVVQSGSCSAISLRTGGAENIGSAVPYNESRPPLEDSCPGKSNIRAPVLCLPLSCLPVRSRRACRSRDVVAAHRTQ